MCVAAKKHFDKPVDYPAEAEYRKKFNSFTFQIKSPVIYCPEKERNSPSDEFLFLLFIFQVDAVNSRIKHHILHKAYFKVFFYGLIEAEIVLDGVIF